MADVVVAVSINADLSVRVDRHAAAGETVLGWDLLQLLGGKGANQAVAAARAGAAARLIGVVGDDGFASLVVDSLTALGVSTAAVRRTRGATGVAVITVDNGGENRIIVVPGANAAMTVADVETCTSPGDVLLTQGEIPAEVSAAALASARRRGALAILNPSPAGGIDPSALTEASVVLLNETELAALSGVTEPPPGDQNELVELARRLRRRDDQAITLTLGSRGCMVVERAGVTAIPAHRIPAVVDTTGAGDCFAGYLAASLAERRTLVDSCRMAAIAAALSVGRRGAAASIPDRDEVESRATATTG